MIFSSLIFLFVFLPIVLTAYYISSTKFKNIILLLASLFFYAWGEHVYILIMLLSILCNYIFGILVYKNDNKSGKKVSLLVAVMFNIGMLGVFKYSGFIVYNLNQFLGINMPIPSLRLPLGISFFTFQALSYVVDVYRNDAKVQKNLFNLALYISLFPQLVAGPIVRYQTVADQIEQRSHSIDKFGEGVNRFVIGLFKKVVISNSLGVIVDSVFMNNPKDIAVATAWLAIISYSLQIFFDFSGYSDMAIGLGKMFGFDFLENFNYPYISKSVSEFWRRWHISLGSWFRDYVYIPLGGSRRGKVRTYINLFVVWFLTGFWHGASWNFIAWGLYFGILIAIEKAFLEKMILKRFSPIAHIYLILAVIGGWILFRSDNLWYAYDFTKTMFGINKTHLYDATTFTYLNDNLYLIIFAIVLSTPVFPYIGNKIKNKNPKLLENIFAYAGNSIILCVLLLIVIMNLVNSTYNPFLYFRF